MGVSTTFLKLLKPSENDYYNEQTEQAENWDKVDKFAKDTSDELESLDIKTRTATTIGNTQTETDILQLWEVGLYRSESANNKWINLPNGCGYAFELEVTSIKSGYRTLKIKSYDSNRIWINTNNSSVATAFVGWSEIYSEAHKPTTEEIGALNKDKMFNLKSDETETTTLNAYFHKMAQQKSFIGLYTTRRQHTDIPDYFGIDERVEVTVLSNDGSYGLTILLKTSVKAVLGVQWNPGSTFTFKILENTTTENVSDGNYIFKDPITRTMIIGGEVTNYTQDQFISFPQSFSLKPCVANVNTGTDTDTTLSVIMWDVIKNGFKARCLYGGAFQLRSFSYIAIGRY